MSLSPARQWISAPPALNLDDPVLAQTPEMARQDTGAEQGDIAPDCPLIRPTRLMNLPEIRLSVR